MATEYARLVFKVDSAGLAKAQTQLDGIRKKSGGASQETEKLTREIKLLSAAAGTLAAVALKKSIVTVAQFSQEIANLSAITGAAGKDLEFYEKQARQIGATTSLSASQAAIAFKLIASAKPDLLNSAEALADVGAAARGVSDVMARVREGSGSLTLLLSDPSVWESLKRVLRGAEESRLLKRFITKSLAEEEGGEKATRPEAHK